MVAERKGVADEAGVVRARGESEQGVDDAGRGAGVALMAVLRLGKPGP